jgi:hypothetical protein
VMGNLGGSGGPRGAEGLKGCEGLKCLRIIFQRVVLNATTLNPCI